MGSDSENPVYTLSLDPVKLNFYLSQLGGKLHLEPVNTRFIFDDATRQLEVIQPAVIGRELDLEKSMQSIQEKVGKGEHSAELVFNITKPAVTDEMTGAQLGITELVEAANIILQGIILRENSEYQDCCKQFSRTFDRTGRDILHGFRAWKYQS